MTPYVWTSPPRSKDALAELSRLTGGLTVTRDVVTATALRLGDVDTRQLSGTLSCTVESALSDAVSTLQDRTYAWTAGGREAVDAAHRKWHTGSKKAWELEIS